MASLRSRVPGSAHHVRADRSPAQRIAQQTEPVHQDGQRSRSSHPVAVADRLRRATRRHPLDRRPTRSSRHEATPARERAEPGPRQPVACHPLEEGAPPAGLRREPPPARGRRTDLALRTHPAVGLHHDLAPPGRAPAARPPLAPPPLRIRPRHQVPGPSAQRRHGVRVRTGPSRAGASRGVPHRAGVPSANGPVRRRAARTATPATTIYRQRS